MQNFVEKEKYAVIIPIYNHEEKVADVIKNAMALGVPIFVIDDGSTDRTYETIRHIKGIHILRHIENQGKGAALITGFSHAAKIADWAITIDADGQHNPKDVVQMIRAIPKGKRPIVVGSRQDMTAGTVPWTSRSGRKFSNFWVRLAGGPVITDSQSGFRIYPLPECLNLGIKSRRFEFEVEILVRANRHGIPLIEAPISVNYRPGTGRISHFHPFYDFMRNARTFTQLIIERIL